MVGKTLPFFCLFNEEKGGKRKARACHAMHGETVGNWPYFRCGTCRRSSLPEKKILVSEENHTFLSSSLNSEEVVAGGREVGPK